MSRINIDQLCRDFEACLGWPYKTPGTNDERGIDCSGMFVRGYRLQGASIYHGSNTIWRQHLGAKGKIVGTGDLKKGMAVFKWKPEGDPQRDGQGNFCHIGLVVSVYPLRIIHASTVGMKVTADTRLGKWQYWGYLADGDYDGSAAAQSMTSTPPVQEQRRNQIYDAVASLPMGQPLLRKGMRGEDVKRLQGLLTRHGFPLEVDGIFGRKTYEAVWTFQMRNGIGVDGIVGPVTWNKLLG